ncbi:MAG: tyrosine-type recombinase/integrase [Vicinamibacteraceae bacterium]
MNVQQLRKLVRETTADTLPVGDGLVLRRQGGPWTWSVLYRANGHRRRVTLGKYPRLSLSAARTAASKVLRQVDLGEDPQVAQRAARAAAERAKRDSIEALAHAYIQGHSKKHKRRWRRDASTLRCEVLPTWKGRTVTSITRRDCRELVRAIADRPAPTQAMAVARLLSKVFNYAVDEEWIEQSPATRIIPRQRKDQDHETKQAYSPEEIRRIWVNTESLLPIERVPIRLGLLLGQRPTEISDLQWPELEGHWWRIPGARSKNGRPHRVYLVQQALDALATVDRIQDEEYVFAGRRGAKQLGQVNVQAFAGVRAREKPRHALRHTVGTGMAAIGVSPNDRSKVLNHIDQTTTGIYDEHSYDREKRLAFTRWARRLAQILAQHEERKVVSISQSRRRMV